ncbi:MAG: PQQ-binding-like beta-propeller repeat protein [Bryobacteraceae bacterium]
MVRSLLWLAPFALAFGADIDGWPRWRGPLDDGMARGDAPTEWSDTKNIAWKTTIPGRGHSSPVVWGGKIFVTTAIPAAEVKAAGGGGRGGGGGAAAGVEHRFVVMAIDRETGKILWERTVRSATPREGYHQRYGSFASNSPITDGKLVYAFFGSRGIYALDMDGKIVWKRDDFPEMKMRMQFGEGVPSTLHGDTLLLGFDQQEGSYLIALDKTTGKEKWRVERDEISAWSPPYVVEVEGKKQVIVSATNKVRAYEFATGKLIWECGGLGPNVIPAPVVHNGTVIVMSGFRDPNLLAIKLGRTGDLTGTDAIVWTNQRGNSYTPSPVLHDGKLYMLTDNGMLSCLDAATGKAYYAQQRLPKAYSFKASPVGANGKLYLSAEDGDVIVVKMGEKFEVLATNTMPDQSFISTPAILDGTIYLRSQNTLYCVRNR